MKTKQLLFIPLLFCLTACGTKGFNFGLSDNPNSKEKQINRSEFESIVAKEKRMATYQEACFNATVQDKLTKTETTKSYLFYPEKKTFDYNSGEIHIDYEQWSVRDVSNVEQNDYSALSNYLLVFDAFSFVHYLKTDTHFYQADFYKNPLKVIFSDSFGMAGIDQDGKVSNITNISTYQEMTFESDLYPRKITFTYDEVVDKVKTTSLVFEGTFAYK